MCEISISSCVRKAKQCAECGVDIDARAMRCRSCSARRVWRSTDLPTRRAKYLQTDAAMAKLRAGLHNPDAIARRAQTQSDNALSHIPEDYRPLYRSLKRYATPAERLEMVRDQMRKDGVEVAE